MAPTVRGCFVQSLHSSSGSEDTCLEDQQASTSDASTPRAADTPAAAYDQAPFSFVYVPHHLQSNNWDCGLACVLMMLRALGMRHDLAMLRALCPTTSIWTIDLAHLLRHFGLEVTFWTITLGTNPQYGNVESTAAFYMENLDEDEIRVQKLFEAAPLAGIHVEQRSISLETLKNLLLSGRWLVLALVNKNQLLGGDVVGNVEMALGSALGMTPSYAGHYIVLCGYDGECDHFFVKDPAADLSTLSMPSSTIERARKAFGTDEDLILVRVPVGLAIHSRPCGLSRHVIQPHWQERLVE